jgi:hypothetical protein
MICTGVCPDSSWPETGVDDLSAPDPGRAGRHVRRRGPGAHLSRDVLGHGTGPYAGEVCGTTMLYASAPLVGSES